MLYRTATPPLPASAAASSPFHSTMNVNSDAVNAYLRLSRVFRGVDAVMQAPSGVQFPLYSSSEISGSSSSSDSGDSSISSASMDDANSLPSMQRGDDGSSISSVETESSEDTMEDVALQPF